LDKVKAALPPKGELPSENELATYRSEVECHRERNKGAFKVLWYNLRRDPFSNLAGTFDIPGAGESADTLNAVSSLFRDHPFAIPAEANPTTHLHTLNRDRDTIESYNRFMRRAAKRWVEDCVLRQPQSTMSGGSDTDALREAQISLFEIIWTNTLEQWKAPVNVTSESAPTQEPPAYSPQEPEPKLASSQETVNELENLDRNIQTSISRAKKPIFTTAFCGMVKAGKSLFLNALIGTSILPSDGMLRN
jgi:hypothetical protein